MPCVTYLMEQELRRIKRRDTITDNDILKWMDYVEEVSGERPLIDQRTIKVRGKWLFSRQYDLTLYAVYFHTCGPEYQILNLAGDGTTSINQHVTKWELLNYLIGYVGGYSAKEQNDAINRPKTPVN